MTHLLFISDFRLKHMSLGWFFRAAAFACLLCVSEFSIVWGQLPEVLLEEEEAFRAAIAAIEPSVLQIETFGGLERVGEALVAEGPTTGTVIAEDGWIISSLFNFRQQPASILVTLPDGKRAPARIAARDYSRDLALLKIETDEKLTVPEFGDSDDLDVGQWTIAIGKTYDKQFVSQSVGIVSALGRAYGKAIQTDAKVSPINYGGPLIDLSGRVVGILSPISPGTFLEGDSSQLYDSGVGFAIPIQQILKRLPTMQSGEDIHSGKLGIVTEEQNELVGPVRIAGATPGSPAAKVDLESGDIIIEAAGQPISLLAHLLHALGPADAGEELEVVVERDSQRVVVKPTLVEKVPVYRRRYLGLRVERTDEGLKILAIEPNSPAAGTSLAVGQIIVSADGKPIESKADLQREVSVLELDETFTLGVLAGEQAQPNQTNNADQTKKNDKPDRSIAEVQLVAATWPNDLVESLPAVDPRIAENMAVEIVDVVLGDFPNKAFAIIPPLSDQRELGLLILFPEPGESDREKAKDYWSAFCRDQGWIVAVVNSGDPSRWAREEIELAGRVLGRLGKNYKIDKAQTVIGGLGVGGRIALAAGATEIQRVSGILAIGVDLSRFGLRRANSPLQSVDFLLVGDIKPLVQTAEKLDELGYAANVVEAANVDTSKWESFPGDQIRLWLEGLGRL